MSYTKLSLADGIGEGTRVVPLDLVEENDLRHLVSCGIPLERAETLSQVSDLVVFHDCWGILISHGRLRIFPKDREGVAAPELRVPVFVCQGFGCNLKWRVTAEAEDHLFDLWENHGVEVFIEDHPDAHVQVRWLISHEHTRSRLGIHIHLDRVVCCMISDLFRRKHGLWASRQR
jgi:hypothetical protein